MLPALLPSTSSNVADTNTLTGRLHPTVIPYLGSAQYWGGIRKIGIGGAAAVGLGKGNGGSMPW